MAHPTMNKIEAYNPYLANAIKFALLNAKCADGTDETRAKWKGFAEGILFTLWHDGILTLEETTEGDLV